MRLTFFVLCVVAAMTAQESTPAPRLLEDTSRKYEEIDSYEYSAIATRPLDGGFTGKLHIQAGYASPNRTPPDLPVPMLGASQFTLVGVFGWHGNPARVNRHSLAMPGPFFSSDTIAARVRSAKLTGTEMVHSRSCEVVSVLYEGTRRNPKRIPIRYWIDPNNMTVWKMQFSELDPLSKTGELAHWTVIWDSWIEHQPPPTWLVEAGKKMAAEERSELIGREAPEIIGTSLSGDPFRLSNLKGIVVVLDFWGTWCGPCSEEMASLERLRSSLSGKAVQIWSVTEDKPDAAKRWIAERGHTLPTAIAARNTAFKSYGIDILPQVVIVSPQGRVIHQWAGLKKEADVLKAIGELTAQ